MGGYWQYMLNKLPEVADYWLYVWACYALALGLISLLVILAFRSHALVRKRVQIFLLQYNTQGNFGVEATQRPHNQDHKFT